MRAKSYAYCDDRHSKMTTVEVITSVERRRRWSRAEKERLVAASLEPGASVASIAREAGIHPSQLYGWRRQMRARPEVGFAPVQITPATAPAHLPRLAPPTITLPT